MPGDLSKPLTSEGYATQLASTRENQSDLAKALDATSTLNPPVGAKRWNSTNRYWEVCTNSTSTGTWAKMVDDATTRYEVRVWKADALNTGRNFSITGDAAASAVSFDGSGNVALSLTISNLAATKGGTGQTTWSTGQMLFASGTNALAKLSVGTAGQVLRSTGTLPAWSTLANGDLPATLSNKTIDVTNTVTLNDNQFTLRDQTDTTKTAQFDCAGIATATPRTYTLPNLTGTLALIDNAQTFVNKELGSGCAWNGNTLPLNKGGTGQTTWSTGGIAYVSSGTALSGAVLSGILHGNGAGAPTATSITGVAYGNGASAPTVATAAQMSAALNINGQTEDTTPDIGADFLIVYDASAAAARKVLMRRAIGRVPRSTTATNAVVGDAGKCIALTAGITIPSSVFAAGDAVSLYNDSAAAVTITQGASLTLRQAGTTNTGNRTLAARGMATLWFNSATEAVISGSGLS